MDMVNVFDYATLKFIWWLAIGFLLIGFAIMDGHDLGVCTLLPFVAKSDDERRIVINTIAAHWEGNQAWLITGGGAIFAAFPLVYATAFSGFYWAMLAVLWAMFFRPVGFKYRSLHPSALWRRTWDWCLFIGSAAPAFLFGVALGNVMQGVPFHFDETMRVFYTGSFWALLNPFALLCGAMSLSMLTLHGGIYLMHRTDKSVYRRSQSALWVFLLLTLLLFSLGGLWLKDMQGYVVSGSLAPNSLPNPLAKTVVAAQGAWLHNYQQHSWLSALPLSAYVGFIAAWLLAWRGKTLLGFICSSLAVAAVILTFAATMFPFILPSSSDFASSLTVWDATASHRSLTIMLFATVIMMPIIIAYTSWAFRIMRGKISADYIRENHHSAY